MANGKKVALVTGSNRGIGFETARQLGKEGVVVIVSARTEREAAEAAGKLRAEGIEAEFVVLDVTKAADRTAAATFIESALWQAGYSGQQWRLRAGRWIDRPARQCND